MFTLIQGDHTAPVDLLRQLVTYLGATFLHTDVGAENFQGGTFIRTRSAFDVVADGFLLDVYLLSGAILLAIVLGPARRRGPGHAAALVRRAHGLAAGRARALLAGLLGRADGAAAVRAGHRLGGPDPVPLDRRRLPQPVRRSARLHPRPLAAVPDHRRAAAGRRGADERLAAPRGARRRRGADGAGEGARRDPGAVAARAAARRGPGDRADRRQHEPGPHEHGADRGRVQHARRLPLHRARAGQPRRRPRPGARPRVDLLHRDGELPGRLAPGLAGPARPRAASRSRRPRPARPSRGTGASTRPPRRSARRACPAPGSARARAPRSGPRRGSSTAGAR